MGVTRLVPIGVQTQRFPRPLRVLSLVWQSHSPSGSEGTVRVPGSQSIHNHQGENVLRSPCQTSVLVHWQKLRHIPGIARYNLTN